MDRRKTRCQLFKRHFFVLALSTGFVHGAMAQQQILLPSYQPGMGPILISGGIESAKPTTNIPAEISHATLEAPQSVNVVFVQERARPVEQLQPNSDSQIQRVSPPAVQLQEQRAPIDVIGQPLNQESLREVPKRIQGQPPQERVFDNPRESTNRRVEPQFRGPDPARRPESSRGPEGPRGPESVQGPPNRQSGDRREAGRGSDMRGPQPHGPWSPESNRGPNQGPNQQGPHRPMEQGPDGNAQMYGNMMRGGMDYGPGPNNGGRPSADPLAQLDVLDRVLNSPAIQKIMQLKEETIQLKAELKIREVEMRSKLEQMEMRTHLMQEMTEIQKQHMRRSMEEQANGGRGNAELQERQRDLERQRSERGGKVSNDNRKSDVRPHDRPDENRDAVIREQSEAIGKLKAELRELAAQREKDATIRRDLEQSNQERTALMQKIEAMVKEQAQLAMKLEASKRHAEQQAALAERAVMEAKEKAEAKKSEKKNKDKGKEQDDESNE